MPHIAHSERRAYRVGEFCEQFGLSRESAYSLMRGGKLKFVVVAGRRLIPAESAEALLENGDGSTSRRGQHLSPAQRWNPARKPGLAP